MHALPLRLHSDTIGALSLFSSRPRGLSAEDLRIGQALADVAISGILQERAIRRREVLAEQLQTALNSQPVIDQAKGVLAECGQLDMAQAFTLLRSHARANHQRLSDLARDVISGTTTMDALLHPTPRQTPSPAPRRRSGTACSEGRVSFPPEHGHLT